MACRLLDALCNVLRPSDEVRLVPTLGPITEQHTKVTATPQFQERRSPRFARRYLIMAFSMTDSQQVPLSIKALDKKGNPAALDSVSWATDNSELLSLTPSADGLTCVVAAVGPLGTANVTMRADADMSPTNTVEIVGTLEITITPGSATVVELVPGTPTEITP